MKKWFLLPLFAASFLAAQTVIIQDHQPTARIELPGKAPEKENDIFLMNRQEIADRLNGYLQKSTGASLPVGEGPGTRIQLQVETGKLDPEGFRIEFPDAQLITITGGSLRGLEYGVYDFLERFLGVRWLFPGELGTVIPKHATISIPRQKIEQNPSLLRRFLAGGSHLSEPEATYYHWMVFNRGNFHTRLNTTHALWHLIPSSEYGEKRPDFFPMYQNKRFIPKPGQNIWWQPCLSAPGITEAAAAHIPQGAKVETLGANDGGRHCECPRCLALDSNRPNVFGVPDRTRSFLEFCNRVADLRPEITFGFPAYADTAEPPPNFRLRPGLIPSITCDSFQWLDPQYRDTMQNLVKRWQATAAGPLGWYDYIYGNHYTLPRMYTRQLAANLKWLYNHGVRYLSAEYYPKGDWQDALKVYVYLRLAWDISADPEAIIDDWCRAAVGPQAAPFLKAYFDRLEKFWTSPEIRQTPWFAKRGIYLNWTDSSYLDAMPETLVAECEELLNQTVAAADCQPRAEYFRRKFLETKPKLLLWKQNQALRLQAEKLNFDRVVHQADFNAPRYTWGSLKQDAATGRFRRDETGGRNGTPALLIDANGANRLIMCYLGYVKAISGKTYRVSIWSRWEKLTPGATVSISIRWQKNGKWLDNSYSLTDKQQATETPAPWHRTTLYVTAPPISDLTMVVLPGVNGSDSGLVWFDDFSAETTSYSLEELAAWEKINFNRSVYRENFDRSNYIWQATGNRTHFVRDEKGGRNHSPALRINHASGDFINFISLPGPGKYRISGWYRGDAATVKVKWQNTKPQWLSEDYTVSSSFPASAEWRRFVLYANSPPNTDLKIVPMLSLTKSNGQVWFDDLLIETHQ